ECSCRSSGYLRAASACRSVNRQFFPLACRGEAVEVEQGSAIHDGMTDLDHAPQSNETLLLNLISPEQFSVIAKVAQKPGQFPEGFLGAVDATSNRACGQ